MAALLPRPGQPLVTSIAPLRVLCPGPPAYVATVAGTGVELTLTGPLNFRLFEKQCVAQAGVLPRLPALRDEWGEPVPAARVWKRIVARAMESRIEEASAGRSSEKRGRLGTRLPPAGEPGAPDAPAGGSGAGAGAGGRGALRLPRGDAAAAIWRRGAAASGWTRSGGCCAAERPAAAACGSAPTGSSASGGSPAPSSTPRSAGRAPAGEEDEAAELVTAAGVTTGSGRVTGIVAGKEGP